MSLSKWMAIVNPRARSGRVAEEWSGISDLLTKNGISFDVAFTKHKYHAVELTIQALKDGFRHIISVGGDGTIHEIVNGIFFYREIDSTDVTLAVIPSGSGNDWSRMYDISPTDPYKTVISMLKGNTALQDITKVSYTESGVQNVRYMANTAGIGYDPVVCYYCNRKKDKGVAGKMVYVSAAMRALLAPKYRKAHITVDGNVFYSRRIFSIALGIGKYSGGGMIQTPNAVVNDGLLDLTVIPMMPRLKVLSHFTRLFSGTIYDVKAVKHTVGKEITIETNKPDRLEIDGEVVGYTPVTFKIIPRALRVVVGSNFKADLH